jgi:hypothetical protein
MKRGDPWIERLTMKKPAEPDRGKDLTLPTCPKIYNNDSI